MPITTPSITRLTAIIAWPVSSITHILMYCSVIIYKSKLRRHKKRFDPSRRQSRGESDLCRITELVFLFAFPLSEAQICSFFFRYRKVKLISLFASDIMVENRWFYRKFVVFMYGVFGISFPNVQWNEDPTRVINLSRLLLLHLHSSELRAWQMVWEFYLGKVSNDTIRKKTKMPRSLLSVFPSGILVPSFRKF